MHYYVPLVNVKEFNDFFEFSRSDTLPFRVSLIVEELREMKHGLETGNKKEIIDGICDLYYVLAGTTLNFQNSKTELTSYWYSYQSSLAIFDNNDDNSIDKFFTNFIDSNKNPLTSIDFVEMCNKIEESISGHTLNDDIVKKLVIQVRKLLALITYYYPFFNGDREILFILQAALIETNFTIVHENNMKKVWTKEQLNDMLPGYVSKSAILNGQHVYIVKNQNGKLMKPKGFEKPQLIVPS